MRIEPPSPLAPRSGAPADARSSPTRAAEARAALVLAERAPDGESAARAGAGGSSRRLYPLLPAFAMTDRRVGGRSLIDDAYVCPAVADSQINARDERDLFYRCFEPAPQPAFGLDRRPLAVDLRRRFLHEEPRPGERAPAALARERERRRPDAGSGNGVPYTLGAGSAAAMYLIKYMSKDSAEFSAAVTYLLDCARHFEQYPSTAGDAEEGHLFGPVVRHLDVLETNHRGSFHVHEHSPTCIHPWRRACRHGFPRPNQYTWEHEGALLDDVLR